MALIYYIHNKFSNLIHSSLILYSKRILSNHCNIYLLIIYIYFPSKKIYIHLLIYFIIHLYVFPFVWLGSFVLLCVLLYYFLTQHILLITYWIKDKFQKKIYYKKKVIHKVINKAIKTILNTLILPKINFSN